MRSKALCKKWLAAVSAFAIVSGLLTACAPEVGSDRWCSQLADKPKGEWTADETKNFVAYCVLGSK